MEEGSAIHSSLIQWRHKLNEANTVPATFYFNNRGARSMYTCQVRDSGSTLRLRTSAWQIASRTPVLAAYQCRASQCLVFRLRNSSTWCTHVNRIYNACFITYNSPIVHRVPLSTSFYIYWFDISTSTFNEWHNCWDCNDRLGKITAHPLHDTSSNDVSASIPLACKGIIDGIS